MKQYFDDEAFTIVELLAVIIILSVLTLLIVPNVSNYLREGKDDYNNDLKENLILMAKDFYSDETERFPRNDSFKMMDYVTIKELSTLNYSTSKLEDSDGNDCSDKSYVMAINEGVGTKYYACLICGDNSYFDDSEKDYCGFNNFSSDLEDDDIYGLNCKIIKKEANTTGGYNVTISSSVTSGYIKRIYVVGNDDEITEQLSFDESNSMTNNYTKVISSFSLDNYIYVVSDKNKKVRCN